VIGKRSLMAAPVDLKQMTIPDELRLMEALWKDLSHGDANITSPEWHGDVLAERDRLIESGEETFLDWEVAKKKLRDEL
jgi:hypothetical protein